MMVQPGEEKNRQAGPPFPIVLFDWGDTVMKDDPAMSLPMAQWPRVEAVEGAGEMLRQLHLHRIIGMVTGAEVSTEADIRTALRRVNLDGCFDRIFCFKNTGFHKPSLEFYRHVLQALEVRPDEVLMVGDNYEKDVLAANRAGIRAVWFNPLTKEDKTGELHRTIHTLAGLSDLLNTSW